MTRIFLAGHRGMVGGAILRRLQARGDVELLTRTHAELDAGSEALPTPGVASDPASAPRPTP